MNFVPAVGAKYKFDYGKVCAEITEAFDGKKDNDAYALIREFSKIDLFFLLYFVCGIEPVNHPWVVARCYEVGDKNEWTLDLWAREHFKSTIITFGLVIQKLLQDPERRICIFSHTRDLAKAFLLKLKTTFETNQLLKRAFPDIFYANPLKQSPKWNIDDGLTLKRKNVYNELSVEAWGITDGMPTGKHFTDLVYDDLVTEKSVSTPEQMKKLRDCFQLSQYLGTRGGAARIAGTIYHWGDLYCELEKTGTWNVRKYPALTNEKDFNSGVLLTNDELLRKYNAPGVGKYIFSCQMLLNPISPDMQRFERSWLRTYKEIEVRLNKYIIVDPANEKKKTSDYTAIMVVGVDSQNKYFILDMVRDKLGLRERWEKILSLVKKHNPFHVGYEKYGMQSDIEYFNQMMQQTGVYFTIVSLGGTTSKHDRIMKLPSLFEAGRIFLPQRYMQGQRDILKEFIEDEYVTAPYSEHDDMMDCLARVLDEKMEIIFPGFGPPRKEKAAVQYDPYDSRERHETWNWYTA